jgi:hypothetical protein
MLCVGFEPTVPASEQVKTVHASDRSATVTGWSGYIDRHFLHLDTKNINTDVSFLWYFQVGHQTIKSENKRASGLAASTKYRRREVNIEYVQDVE